MPIQFIRLDAYPREIAVTKTGSVVLDGAFFLDFSRPLQAIRWFGIRNRHLGPQVGLLVPVIHQFEQAGGFVVTAMRDDPFYGDIEALWQMRYPSNRPLPDRLAEPQQVSRDFAEQFPQDRR